MRRKTTVHSYWNSPMKVRPWYGSRSPYLVLTLEIAETHGSVCDLDGKGPAKAEFRGPTVVWLEEDHMKDIIEQYEALKDQRAKGAREEKAVAEEVA